MNKAVIFYHNDLDGICAAAIVNAYLKNKNGFESIINIKMNYGYAVNWDLIDKDTYVSMVDFSLPLPDMEMMKDKAGKFVWIDHHKTAIGLPVEISGIRRIGEAGCELAWEYYMCRTGRTRKTPDAVTMLGRWDVWDHYDPCFDLFQMGMRALDPKPEDPIWKTLLDIHGGILVDRIVESGRPIVQYLEVENKDTVGSYCFITNFCGLKCLAINTSKHGSQIFKSVWDEAKYDAMIVYRWSPKSGMYTFSMYTEKEGVDVSAVCKKHGGGGHTGAAGFQSSNVPFEQTTEKP